MSKFLFLLLCSFSLVASAERRLLTFSPVPSETPIPTIEPSPTFFPTDSPSPTPFVSPTASATPTPTPTPAGTGYCVTSSEPIGMNDYMITAADCSVEGCPSVRFRCNRSFEPTECSCPPPCQGVEIDCDRMDRMDVMEFRTEQNSRQIKKLKKRVKTLEELLR